MTRRRQGTRGARSVSLRNHEGQKLHKGYLGPTLKSFDPGRTIRRSSDRRMNETQMTLASCWCGRGYVNIGLDRVNVGNTESCGRKGCTEAGRAS